MHGKQVMGEAKRRKAALKENYGKEETIFPWLPITKTQSEQFVKWSTKGAWLGIGFLIIFWLTIRFAGPAFGLWNLE